MAFSQNVVQFVLTIIQEYPGITYEEISSKIKKNKIKTNRALLNILINDLIVTSNFWFKAPSF